MFFKRFSKFGKKSKEGARFIYRSDLELLGIPLVNIDIGDKKNLCEVTTGIVAVGNIAVGAVAIGGISVGLLSVGILAAGLLAYGGKTLKLKSKLERRLRKYPQEYYLINDNYEYYQRVDEYDDMNPC